MSSENGHESDEPEVANVDPVRYQHVRHEGDFALPPWRPNRHNIFRMHPSVSIHPYQELQPTSNHQNHPGWYGYPRQDFYQPYAYDRSYERSQRYEHGHITEAGYPPNEEILAPPYHEPHDAAPRYWQEPVHSENPSSPPRAPRDFPQQSYREEDKLTHSHPYWNYKPRASRHLAEWESSRESYEALRESFVQADTQAPLAHQRPRSTNVSSIIVPSYPPAESARESYEAPRKSFVQADIQAPLAHQRPRSTNVSSIISSYPAETGANHPGHASQQEYIFELRPYDVLCGRGVPTRTSPGNQAFRELIKQHEVEYIACRRNDKPVIATNLMEKVRTRGGRFLRRVKISHLDGRERYAWNVLGANRVYEKICQALRDGAPQIRQRMLSLSNKGESRDKENSINHNATYEEFENKSSSQRVSSFEGAGAGEP
jgi:hypothetical protein